MTRVVPVVIAGGTGTRLWPLSRELHPKQFLDLGQGRTILQQTLLRVGDAVRGPAFDRPVILANEEHRFLVEEQARAVDREPSCIVLEPAGRNTAPAVTAAAALLESGDPVMVVMPADHHIADPAAFLEALELACRAAAGGRIVTLGVPPERPETGYGYIRFERGDDDLHSVMEFVEKPDEATAAGYLRAGDYLWNCGIFIFKPSVWLQAIHRYRPEISAAVLEAVRTGSRDGKFFRLAPDAFLRSPAESVDYAVMESAPEDPEIECAVVVLKSEWSDLGNWRAIREQGDRDPRGNRLSGDVVAMETQNTVVMASGRLVAVLGCDNLVIAETADAVLVADLARSQDLSGMVQLLRENARDEVQAHRRVYRPWGSYESIIRGEGYQVKRLTIRPGCRLSLQLHHRRAEHWVVVRGTATVARDNETFELHENESVYIPREIRHRLGNDTDAELEVIEVQTGSYLGEDDIIRFEDDFRRVPCGS